MKASKILLLLAILTFGGFIEAARLVRGHADLGPSGCRVLGYKFSGPSYTFESEQRQAVPAGTALDVENAFGAVQVSRGNAGEVVLKMRTVVFRETEEEARAFSERVRASAELSGTSLRVATNRDEVERRDNDVGFETHLQLTVPPDTPVTVRNEHGAVDVSDVAAADVWGSFEAVRLARVAGPAVVKAKHGSVWISGVQGALSLTSRHGDVEVEDVGERAGLETQHGSVTVRRTGDLTVDAQHGDVEVETVRGALELRTQHGRVQAREVTGNVLVESSFGDLDVAQVGGEARTRVQHGRLTVRDVKGPLFAKASFNDVAVERIGGAVDIAVEHGGVQAESLEGGGRVEATGNEVVIDGFRGALAVQTQRAGMRLVPSAPLQWPVVATATHGAIRLEVPAGSRFELDIEARRGELSANLPGLAITRSDSSHLAGTVGGGGQLVKLIAENGDVRLEPRVEVVSQPAPASPAQR